MPGLLNCALHANYFSTPQQFTQSVGRMDSGIVNTCKGSKSNQIAYMMETLSTKHQCQVIMKDPEKNSGSSWDSNPWTCIEHAYWTPPYLLWQLDWGLLHF